MFCDRSPVVLHDRIAIVECYWKAVITELLSCTVNDALSYACSPTLGNWTFVMLFFWATDKSPSLCHLTGQLPCNLTRDLSCNVQRKLFHEWTTILR
jgi:hypothetical protein